MSRFYGFDLRFYAKDNNTLENIMRREGLKTEEA